MTVTGCSAMNQSSPTPTFSKLEKPAVCATIDDLSTAGQIRETQRVPNQIAETSLPELSVHLSSSDIEITQPGTYRISGTTTSGRILVDSKGNGKVKLILAGLDITTSEHSAIEVLAAADFEIELAAGTQNKVTSTKTQKPDPETNTAVIFSKTDLALTGSGKLIVISAASDGIASRDGISISGGEFLLDVKDEGIQAKDFIMIESGKFDIRSQGDGIRTTSSGDVQTGWIEVQSGEFFIASQKDALQAETNLILKNGKFQLSAQDDAITANCFIWLESEIEISAVDDAVHSNNGIALAGGRLIVKTAYEGIETERLWIYDGDHTIATSNDGINLILKPRQSATGDNANDYSDDVYLHQFGGRVQVDSEVDGVDVSGNIEITGGTLISWGKDGGGNNPLDLSGTFNVSNGTFVAISSSDRELVKHSKYIPNENPKQTYVVFQTETKQPSGLIRFTDSSGLEVLKVSAPENWLFVYITNPQIQSGSEVFMSTHNFKDLQLKTETKNTDKPKN